MKTRILYLITLFLILILAVLYFLWSYLPTVGTLSALAIGTATLWAILLPILSSFPYSFGYFFCLPSPYFGAWLMIINMMNKYVILSSNLALFALLALLLSYLLVTVLHVSTRARTMIWRIPMVSISRSSIAAVSILFLGLGIILTGPSGIKLSPINELFFFATLLLGYIASSMLYINSSYRLYVLSKKLGVQHLEKELSRMWTNIEKTYSDERRDVDLLQFYFYESLRCFIEGDFEKSFIWGYKVIREKTVVNPLEYIDDKRASKPAFSDIRNTLEHSRRKGHIDRSKIREIMRNLFNDCLDLLEREFVFVKKVSESSLRK